MGEFREGSSIYDEKDEAVRPLHHADGQDCTAHRSAHLGLLPVAARRGHGGVGAGGRHAAGVLHRLWQDVRSVHQECRPDPQRDLEIRVGVCGHRCVRVYRGRHAHRAVRHRQRAAGARPAHDRLQQPGGAGRDLL
eukprot:ctg_948.g334